MTAALNSRAAARHRHLSRGGSRLQTAASTHTGRFFFFLFSRSRHRVIFTVIKSVIKAPFVCFVFRLSPWVAEDCTYKEKHMLLRVHALTVYTHVCICGRACVSLCNESSVRVFKQEVEDKLAQRDTRAHWRPNFLIARRRRRRRRVGGGRRRS